MSGTWGSCSVKKASSDGFFFPESKRKENRNRNWGWSAYRYRTLSLTYMHTCGVFKVSYFRAPALSNLENTKLLFASDFVMFFPNIQFLAAATGALLARGVMVMVLPGGSCRVQYSWGCWWRSWAPGHSLRTLRWCWRLWRWHLLSGAFPQQLALLFLKSKCSFHRHHNASNITSHSQLAQLPAPFFS